MGLLVQVADVKRLNGLTTDLQMFALKTLRIPLPGRHPPSAALTSPVRARLAPQVYLIDMIRGWKVLQVGG